MLSNDRADHLSATLRGVSGLRGEFFTSDELFGQEMQALFHGGWMCVGSGDDAGRPGSIYPVRIAGQDILLARDRSGELRCFFNHCSHRGAILADAPRDGCTRIVCPYHAWSYDLAGALRKTPHVGGAGIHEGAGIDPAERGLRAVPVAEWAGLVFANLGGSAEPFERFIAPLAERLRDYDLTNLHFAGDAAATAQANWKIVAENFVESYHLPWIHPTMNRYNPMEDHYQILGGSTYFGQGLLGLEFTDEAVNVLPRFPNLTPEQLTTGESHFIFPNLMFGVLIDFAFAIIMFPETPGRTRERAVVLVNGRDTATDPAFANARATLLERIVSVNNEDMGVTESVQRGRSSLAFAGGCFSPAQERTSRQLQQAYALRMLKASGPPPPVGERAGDHTHHPPRARVYCARRGRTAGAVRLALPSGRAQKRTRPVTPIVRGGATEKVAGVSRSLSTAVTIRSFERLRTNTLIS